MKKIHYVLFALISLLIVSCAFFLVMWIIGIVATIIYALAALT